MNITHQTLIRKMEAEIGKAKVAEKSQEVREHVYSIKALCEVLLEESASDLGSFIPPTSPQTNINYVQTPQQPSTQTVQVSEKERLQTDDGANGDSLFDF
ncbi:YwdI family protein [Bacillus seohaeanensis]|uniref:YwdI family protein n=1 Tax=Bacillus seohaeanensis TaxID=284580 RepID=A0ABW5RQN2_9BACI